MGLRESMRNLFTGSKAIEVTSFTNASTDNAYEFGHLLDTQWLNVGQLSADQLWREQPYLRILVTFLARNIAQLGLHTFQRVSETDRQRLRDDPMALLLGRPNATMTAYELVYELVADLALYDIAYWSFGPDQNTVSGWSIRPIPPAWVTNMTGGDLFAAGGIVVTPPNGKRIEISAENLIIFHGWNPGSPATGSSPVNALRDILKEQIHAWAYRQQVWERGGRVGAVLVRPANAPAWSENAQERFATDWKTRWSGDSGAKAGGTPILEDGMDLKRIGFSAREDDWVNAAKLSLSTVASVYHVNPTMVGVMDNANYSNVREFRRMLYGDTLGPTMAMIEDRINTFVVPRVTAVSGAYVEFNIGEKLQGSFEEQAAALQSAVGRPWMSADEARAKLNLPSMGGEAEQLVIPLNVLLGGQASPNDSGTQNIGKGGELVLIKARAGDTYEKRAEKVLTDFFHRQSKVVLSAIGGKAAYWDTKRWNKELADDLLRLSVLVANDVGRKTAKSLGFKPDDYDTDRTLAFLKTVASSTASNINATTKAQVADAMKSDDEEDTPANVFDNAKSQRAPAAALQLVSTYSGFATTEAARQVSGDKAEKTWLTGANPRPSHAEMDGETVGINDAFSNGSNWPGDGGPDDAGCNCSVEVSIP